jgi:capsular polysaccharide transport system permease protein
MQTLIRAPAFSGPPSEADPEATAPALRTQSTIANTSRLPTALIPIEAIAVPPAIEPRLSPRALSFIAVVLLPIALVAAYLFLIAADQYVAEFRFSLNTVDAPRLDPLSLLAGGASHSPAAHEAQIVVQYMTSRAILDEIGTTLDVRRLFSPPQADWWARLQVPAPIETLVQYWKGQVDPFYDPANGTVTVRVRAFAPGDALHLAQAMVAASEKLVNDLSLRARRDRVSHAEAEVTQAEDRLKSVLGEIRTFRDREGLIDPGEAAKTSGLLASRLRDELVRANAELSTLKTYMRDDAPPVKVLNARIRSLETQQRAVARDLTDADRTHAGALSHLLGSYEQLESERKFAETAYQHALLRLDQARADADRQQVYIASFVPPTLPEEALYPRRWRSLGIVALIAFAIWAIGGLTIQSVRDHF